MNPCHTDAELIRAGQFTASPIVRVLVARIADRGREAVAVRDMLATIRGLIESGHLADALILIDQARQILNCQRTAPHYPSPENDPLKG